MLRFLLFSVFASLLLTLSAKEVKDTLFTRQGDKVIASCNVSVDGDKATIRLLKPRIIPSEELRKACKGDLDKLKAVVFDRVGDYGKVKWKGLTPSSFTIPAGMTYDDTDEGYYIFGESMPLTFSMKNSDRQVLRIPVYIAVYEKKQTYTIEGSTQPWVISIGGKPAPSTRPVQTGSETELIAIHTSEETEADNTDITRALNSIRLIREMLEQENELPFSQTLIIEMSSLKSIQDRVNDPEVLDRINEVILDFNKKETALKEAQKEASLSAQTQEQALMAQQKAEEEARQKDAEEKARIQEEKQQKRTILMIIGGVILAILGFIGNAVLKHFRDVRNQKSIMEMQQSIARQAEHEAGRRSREIVRNKAHQIANQGKNKLRNSVKPINKKNVSDKRKSI